MKKLLFLTGMLCVILSSCNKDDEITTTLPEDTEGGTGYVVLEYTPGPGQYINDPVTGLNAVNTPAEACAWAQSRLEQGNYVSLGSWGGYIVVKFDESIENTGGYDFAISNNSFETSSEPGIVWVMQDSNGNGRPDDEWYELKGSFFGEEGYERNYWVTYQRPEAESSTPWEDSNGERGEVVWLGTYHSQPYYYPAWVSSDSYTLYGSRLPLQAVQDEITGQWRNEAFEWGYADNFGTDFQKATSANLFRISDAVTTTNEEADLEAIDFVKVQTGVNGSAGILGENSTEVCGFERIGA